MDDRVLGVGEEGLDLGAPADRSEAAGEHVGRAPLGVGPGAPPLEGAELANQLGTARGVHRRRIIAFSRPPGAGLSLIAPAAGVAEWQTRGTQNAVSFGTCGFDSHLRHLLYARAMCGRYTLTDPDPRLLRFRFGLTESAEIDQKPRYNVAPTDPVLAVRLNREGEREPGILRWGLIPHSADPEDFDRLLINARAETVAEAAAFRDAFADAPLPDRRRRLLRVARRGDGQEAGLDHPAVSASPSRSPGSGRRLAGRTAPRSIPARSSPASRGRSLRRSTTACR